MESVKKPADDTAWQEYSSDHRVELGFTRAGGSKEAKTLARLMIGEARDKQTGVVQSLRRLGLMDDFVMRHDPHKDTWHCVLCAFFSASPSPTWRHVTEVCGPKKLIEHIDESLGRTKE